MSKFKDHYINDTLKEVSQQKHKATKDVHEEQSKSKGFVFPRPIPHYTKKINKTNWKSLQLIFATIGLLRIKLKEIK